MKKQNTKTKKKKSLKTQDIERIVDIFHDFSYDDILTVALNANLLTSSDIVNAADIYECSDDYHEDALDKFIDDGNALIDKHGENYVCGRIVSEMIKNDCNLLEYIDKGLMLNHLDGSWDLENHDRLVRLEHDQKTHDDLEYDLEEAEERYDRMLFELEDMVPDTMRKKLCDIFGISYYDDVRFREKMSKMLDKLNESSYTNIKLQLLN